MDRMANQIPTVGRLTFRKDGLLFYDHVRHDLHKLALAREADTDIPAFGGGTGTRPTG